MLILRFSAQRSSTASKGDHCRPRRDTYLKLAACAISVSLVPCAEMYTFPGVRIAAKKWEDQRTWLSAAAY